jgi:hypothetical protein
MTRRRAPWWRPALSWLFLILFCLAVPLALLTGWARLTVRDPEIYAQTMRAVADEPRVQQGLADAVTLRSEALLGGENPTASEAIQNRVLAEALGQASAQVAASEEFRDVWEEAHRNAHRLLFDELAQGWGQPVDLDLSPLSGPLQVEVDALGLDLPAELTIDPITLRIEILDADTADRIRRAEQQLDIAFWGSLAAAVVSLNLSIAFAPDRLAAVGRLAFGLAMAMVALMALLLVGQGALAARAGEAGGNAVVIAIADAISQGLRMAAIGLALAGLLLAGMFAGLSSLRGSMVRRTASA